MIVLTHHCRRMDGLVIWARLFHNPPQMSGYISGGVRL